MARKRSSGRRAKRSKNAGCLSGCLSSIFGLIGGLIGALVAVIAGLIQLLASSVKWLSRQKITLPVGEGYQVSGLLVSLLLCFLCMCGSMTYVWTDRQLRAIGLLPTYTPRPTATNTPTPTETSTPTDTLTTLPRPTETPLPTDTSTPSPPLAKVTAPTLNVRAGPGTDYTIVGNLSLDDSVEVVGRNAAGDWLQIVYPANSDRRGWIAADYAKLSGSLATVSEVSAPPTATPEPALALPPGTEVELVDPEGGGGLVGDVGIYYMWENCEYLDVAHDFVPSGTRAVIASWEVCYPERADNPDNARQYYYKVIIPSEEYRTDNSWVNAKYVIVVLSTDTPLPPEATSAPLPADTPAVAPMPTDTPLPLPAVECLYIGNRNTKKFHHFWCSSVGQMKESDKVCLQSREEAIAKGYVPCRRCNP